MPTSKRTTSTEQSGISPNKPYWTSPCGRAVVYVGDCLQVMMAMELEQFSAIVTDPPYGLEFMGKEWDAPWKTNGTVETKVAEGTGASHPFRDGADRVRYGTSDPALFQAWFMARASAMLRVVKPGAHLLSFGGTRMWHRTACGIEDAGWEIRDCLAWVYGSGFPKSQDVSKAIDAALGAEREVIGRSSSGLGAGQFTQAAGMSGGYGFANEYDVTAPATEAAKQWAGWGTCLKPAMEPIVLARKPFRGGVAKCAMDHGCGGLNVDGCLVGDEEMIVQASDGTVVSQNTSMAGANTGRVVLGTKSGRWPSNFLHDGGDEVTNLLPDGAARFFYSPKADSSDRPHGKDGTVHPTVKPLDLMRYLVRLVCSPGRIILDPFMGSGSTGCAVLSEGMRFVGIELDVAYADIAIGRLKLALEACEYEGNGREHGTAGDVQSPHRPGGCAPSVTRFDD
jgi:DNA modification methylase